MGHIRTGICKQIWLALQTNKVCFEYFCYKMFFKSIFKDLDYKSSRKSKHFNFSGFCGDEPSDRTGAQGIDVQKQRWTNLTWWVIEDVF